MEETTRRCARCDQLVNPSGFFKETWFHRNWVYTDCRPYLTRGELAEEEDLPLELKPE